jgi:hypothetical protein
MTKPKPVRGQCRICGRPLDSKNRTGLCSNKTPACRKARDQLTAEEKPGKFRVVINPGDTFGRWTALEAYSMENRYVLCRCACGTERPVFGMALTNDHSLSCGICVKSGPRPAKEPYLTAGQVFARLTVLEDVMYAADYVSCRCECGTVVRIRASSVRNGKTRSCGCLWRDTLTKHGLSKHPLYMVWKGAVLRCGRPDAQGWDNYGDRGITVCEGWRQDVAAFVADIERAIGPRPEGRYETGRAKYELDRTDNDSGYWCGRCAECVSKSRAFNVQWSDRPAQMRNRRKVPKLTKDVLRLTGERDALTAQVQMLTAQLQASRKRNTPPPEPDIRLF